MNDFNSRFDGDSKNKRSIFANAGFRVGIIGGLFIVFLHLINLIVFRSRNSFSDLIIWLVQLISYFFIGKAAAQKHYDRSLDGYSDLQSVQSAGTGGPLVTSFTVWIFIIIRGILLDAFGFFVIMNPVGLFCYIFTDVLIALGIGSLAGKSVVKNFDNQNL